MSDDLPRLKELSDAAKSLKEDRAFSTAVGLLRNRWYAELMAAGSNTLLTGELCSKLRALEAIPVELELLMNDYKKSLHDSRKHA
jgi:hypothetical protein